MRISTNKIKKHIKEFDRKPLMKILHLLKKEMPNSSKITK